MQWVGCEDPIYRNFAVPDPSSTPDDSKCFTVDFTGQWKSERCDQKFGFVCEENMGIEKKCRRLLSKNSVILLLKHPVIYSVFSNFV